MHGVGGGDHAAGHSLQYCESFYLIGFQVDVEIAQQHRIGVILPVDVAEILVGMYFLNHVDGAETCFFPLCANVAGDAHHIYIANRGHERRDAAQPCGILADGLAHCGEELAEVFKGGLAGSVTLYFGGILHAPEQEIGLEHFVAPAAHGGENVLYVSHCVWVAGVEHIVVAVAVAPGLGLVVLLPGNDECTVVVPEHPVGMLLEQLGFLAHHEGADPYAWLVAGGLYHVGGALQSLREAGLIFQPVAAGGEVACVDLNVFEGCDITIFIEAFKIFNEGGLVQTVIEIIP